VSEKLGVPLSPHEERKFEDGEHKARPLVNVRGNDVFVIESLYGDSGHSVNDKLARLLFSLGALRDASAGRVTAVVPYLAYARKDRKTKPRDPVTTRYVAALFRAAQACRKLGARKVFAAATHGIFVGDANRVLAEPAVDEILVTNTVPSFRLDPRLLEEKVRVLDAAELFAQAIARIHGGGWMSSLLGNYGLSKSKDDVSDGGNRLSVAARGPKPPLSRRIRGRGVQALRLSDHLARRDFAFCPDLHFHHHHLAHVEISRRRIERSNHRRGKWNVCRGRSYVLGCLATGRGVVERRGPEEPGDEDFCVDGDGSFGRFQNLTGGCEPPAADGLPEKFSKRRGLSQNGDPSDLPGRGHPELEQHLPSACRHRWLNEDISTLEASRFE